MFKKKRSKNVALSVFKGKIKNADYTITRIKSAKFWSE